MKVMSSQLVTATGWDSITIFTRPGPMLLQLVSKIARLENACRFGTRIETKVRYPLANEWMAGIYPWTSIILSPLRNWHLHSSNPLKKLSLYKFLSKWPIIPKPPKKMCGKDLPQDHKKTTNNFGFRNREGRRALSKNACCFATDGAAAWQVYV